MSLTALTLFALLAAGPQTQEVKIFDGKTLDGWTAMGGGTWEVKDGVIAGRSQPDQPQGVLMWKNPVKDFTARLKFRIRAGDSGFYFRTERVENEVIVHGFQVEVDTSRETGGIYETGGRGWVHKPDFALHDKKAREWYAGLERWVRKSQAELEMKILDARAGQRARSMSD